MGTSLITFVNSYLSSFISIEFHVILGSL